jgi:hypothetical protein
MVFQSVLFWRRVYSYLRCVNSSCTLLCQRYVEIHFICLICQKSRIAKFNSKTEKSLCPYFHTQARHVGTLALQSFIRVTLCISYIIASILRSQPVMDRVWRSSSSVLAKWVSSQTAHEQLSSQGWYVVHVTQYFIVYITRYNDFYNKTVIEFYFLKIFLRSCCLLWYYLISLYKLDDLLYL